MRVAGAADDVDAICPCPCADMEANIVVPATVAVVIVASAVVAAAVPGIVLSIIVAS